MEIYGQFLRYKQKNEKTGQALFTIRKDKDVILCSGISSPLSHKIPIRLTGKFNGNIFEFKECLMCGYSARVMQEFLSTSLFNKVGITTANKTIETLGHDLFSVVKTQKNIETLIKELINNGINPDTSSKILKIIKSEVDFETLLNYILDMGGSYFNAVKLRKENNASLFRRIEENPYILLESGVGIRIVESKAKEMGVSADDDRRIKAVVKYAVEQNEKNGNTKISFHNLVEKIHNNEQNIYKTNILFIAAELTKKEYTITEEDGECYIYRTYIYKEEKEIAEHVRRLQSSKKELFFNTEHIKELESQLDIKYSSEQVRAFSILQSSGLKIVTGGPGTGKTTFLNGCIRMYQKNCPGIKITLCAPTGSAAAKMNSSTGMKATTIHKLLGLTKNNESFSQGKVDADVIIVDEFSMVGVELFNLLLRSIKNGSTLILLGDVNQLPSIDAGNVLSDLIESKVVETHNFVQIFRQKEGNSIIDNSRMIMQGKTGLITDKNFIIKRFKDEELLLHSLSAISRSPKNKFTVFTAAKKIKFKTGVIMLNRLICDIKQSDKEGVCYGYYTFHIGDKVLFGKNNYDKGYYNGETGIITEIQQRDGSTMITVVADEDTLFLENSDLNDIELGYALTAHKAQGSECENAVIVIAQNPLSMLQRRLLYVEITRAKKNVYIMSENDALEKCITNNRGIQRDTGLKNHLLRIL